MTQVSGLTTSRADGDANAFSVVYSNDLAIVTVVNSQLQNENLASNAAVAYSKLATMSTGQILLGNAGTPTATALTGAITVGATGVTTLGAGEALANLAAGSVTDAKLTSPNNSAYRTLLAVGGFLDGAASAATVYGAAHRADSGWDASAGIFATAPAGIYFDDADYAVGSKTQKLRVRAQLHTDTGVDAITHTVGLYPINSTSAKTYTVGSVIAGSTAAFASPASNSLNEANSGDFTIPADGFYVVGITFSGNHTQDINVYAQLQTRSV